MPELNGHIRLRAERTPSGETVLAEQAFCAPFHLSKPYWDGRALLVQVVNSTAGILSGDRLATEVAVGEGASLIVTAPSASRIFTMNEGAAQATQRFMVERGGWLEIAPEPLVPHARSVFRQETSVELAEGAEALFADYLMPGRVARGEAWAWTRLCLRLRVRVAERLVLQEHFDHSGAELQALAALAGMGPGASFWNAVVVSRRLAPDGAWCEAIRALHGGRVWVGLSALAGDLGGWCVRVISDDPVELRTTVGRIRAACADSLPALRSDLRKL